MLRICPKCGVPRPSSEFYTNRWTDKKGRTYTSPRSDCKYCHGKRVLRDYHAKRPRCPCCLQLTNPRNKRIVLNRFRFVEKLLRDYDDDKKD